MTTYGQQSLKPNISIKTQALKLKLGVTPSPMKLSFVNLIKYKIFTQSKMVADAILKIDKVASVTHFLNWSDTTF